MFICLRKRSYTQNFEHCFVFLKHNRDNILINQLIKQDLKMKPIKYESTKLHNFQLLWHDDDVTRTLHKVSES